MMDPTNDGSDATEVTLERLRMRVADLEMIAGEMLREFVFPTHPGRPSYQSGHVYAETVDRWRNLLNGA